MEGDQSFDIQYLHRDPYPVYDIVMDPEPALGHIARTTCLLNTDPDREPDPALKVTLFRIRIRNTMAEPEMNHFYQNMNYIKSLNENCYTLHICTWENALSSNIC